jgi:Subunit ChlI of Mg-chelatase
MVTRVATLAFEGVETRPIDVQVHIAGGLVAFNIVGLADKAVAESRERVRAALAASGLALPAKRITVNLAPAAEGGQPLRSADCARGDGRHRRAAGRCARRLCRPRRTRA